MRQEVRMCQTSTANIISMLFRLIMLSDANHYQQLDTHKPQSWYPERDTSCDHHADLFE